MQLLNRFLNTIGKPLFFGEPEKPANLLEELARLNPNKFYVENVRNLLGVSFERAREIIDEAVADGYFVEAYEIRCPDGAVVYENEKSVEPPPTVECLELDDYGSYEPTDYPAEQLRRVTFYRLAKNS